MSVKKQFINGVIWSSLGRFSSLGIQLVVSIILARILGPYEYGIIGILTVFIAIAQILLDSGFGQALIQRGKDNQIDYSSVFFLNLAIGILLYSILYAVSPLLDDFYNIEDLHKYARLIFLVIPINSLGIIPRTLLTRDMQFKKISIIDITSSLLSGGIGIYAALIGFGVYALIIQMLSINILRTILSIVARKWTPVLNVSFSTIKDLFPFGVNLMLTSLLSVIFNNIHTLIIGRYFNAKDVGYYNQAKQYEQITSNTVTDIVIGVSFPTLVKYKNDIDGLKNAYKRIIEIVIFIVAPLMLGLISFPCELFICILTEKWLSAVPFFQILCIYGATFPLHQINGNILKVLGKGKTLLYVEILRRVLLIVSILATINISIEALLVGQIISMFFVIIVSMYCSGKLINYSVQEQLKDVSVYYLLAFIAVIISFVVKLCFNMSAIGTVIFMTLSICVVYLIGCWMLKVNAFVYLINIIQEKVK